MSDCPVIETQRSMNLYKNPQIKLQIPVYMKSQNIFNVKINLLKDVSHACTCTRMHTHTHMHITILCINLPFVQEFSCNL